MPETAVRPSVNDSETAKHAAEEAVHLLGLTSALGEAAAKLAGVRIVDPRLQTEVAGLAFENPVMVGAGWDKTGRAVDGLHMLGFAGVEVGTVVPQPQAGNPRPRLWTDPTHSVAFNRMGFNSPGMADVWENLGKRRRPGVIGISLGKNKDTPAAQAPEDHARVASLLHDFGDYFVINVSSPNTPLLRQLLDPELLTDNIAAVQEALRAQQLRLGLQTPKPLFVKTTVDLVKNSHYTALDGVLGVCIEHGVRGIIHTNTTVSANIKARYGWQDQPGGVSGSDPDYRRAASEQMRHITRETRGTGLHRIGVGAIRDAKTAIERLQDGAELIQVVTAMPSTKGLAARNINKGIVREIKRRGLERVSDLVGAS